MISKLPKWVWTGAGVLAFIAGMVNAIGFLGFQHHGVTHLTGSATILGTAVANGSIWTVSHVFALIGSFVAGCAISGFIIQNSALQLGRRYGLALFIESILLFAAVPFLKRNSNLGDYLASCACGLQNGMVTTYSGALLRTTHITGAVTDLGIAIGHFLRRLPVDVPRVQLCSVLLISFFLGAVAGGIGFDRFSYETLYFPAALTGAVGFGYAVYRHLKGTPTG